jgi:hypothetical protein
MAVSKSVAIFSLTLIINEYFLILLILQYVCATSESDVQGIPTECECVSVCDHMQPWNSAPKFVREKETELRKKERK